MCVCVYVCVCVHVCMCVGVGKTTALRGLAEWLECRHIATCYVLQCSDVLTKVSVCNAYSPDLRIRPKSLKNYCG